jgi:hypothetical protein
MKNIVIFFLLITLSGCGFVFQNFGRGEYKQLAYGMSKDEVIRKIGEPQKMSTMIAGNKKYEVWEYSDNRPEREKMNALGIIYSKVFFLDGKLVQHDKNRVYAQPSYSYLESINPEDEVKAAKITGQKDNFK